MSRDTGLSLEGAVSPGQPPPWTRGLSRDRNVSWDTGCPRTGVSRDTMVSTDAQCVWGAAFGAKSLKLNIYRSRLSRTAKASIPLQGLAGQSGISELFFFDPKLHFSRPRQIFEPSKVSPIDPEASFYP